MPRYRAGYKRSSVTSSTGAVSENAVVFQSSGGHTHDGSNSSLIETDSYSVWDFQVNTVYSTTPRADRQNRHIEQFKNFISNHVNNNVLEPAGVVLGENVINATNIISNSITTDVIAANAITANEIAAATITTSELATDAIQSLNFSYSSGLYSNAGSFFNLADGTIRTPSMFLNSSGDLYLSNSVVIGATTANTIVDGAAAGANAVPTGGAAADVNNGSTTIGGTKITANSITTSQIATDAIKSGNYNGPDSGEVFSDAGTFLDLSGGNFISRGFAAYSDGSVYISSSATIGSTTASTVVSGAAAGANAIPTGGAAGDVNSNVTTINGGKIRTGNIESTGFVRGSGTYSTTGTRVDLDTGDIIAPNFRLFSNGVIYAQSGNFSGTVNASGGTFTGKITAGLTEVGTNIRGAANYAGIALRNDSWENAWVRRSNNSVYFRAGSSTKYIQVDTSGTTTIQFPNFSVDNNGNVVASNVSITGGTLDIGGSDASSFHVSSSGAHWSGSGSYATAPFRVSSTGALVATSATITGTINASGGTFSGNITASGTITGGTLSGASVTGSTFSTSGSDNVVISTNRITLNNNGGDSAKITFDPSGQSDYGEVNSVNRLKLTSGLGGDLIEMGMNATIGGVNIRSGGGAITLRPNAGGSEYVQIVGSNTTLVDMSLKFGGSRHRIWYSDNGASTGYYGIVVEGMQTQAYSVRIGELYSQGGLHAPYSNMHITGTDFVKIKGSGDPSSGGVEISSTGNLSKNSGSFKIDHPLDSMSENYWLYHSFIEGPYADLIYRGVVELVNGYAEVDIDAVSGMTDGTFVKLVNNVSCFTSNETSWDNVKGYVEGNKLKVYCQNQISSDSVSWLVIGERCDKHMLETEWTDENGRVIQEQRKV